MKRNQPQGPSSWINRIAPTTWCSQEWCMPAQRLLVHRAVAGKEFLQIAADIEEGMLHIVADFLRITDQSAAGASTRRFGSGRRIHGKAPVGGRW